jgi:hypothetical protein
MTLRPAMIQASIQKELKRYEESPKKRYPFQIPEGERQRRRRYLKEIRAKTCAVPLLEEEEDDEHFPQDIEGRKLIRVSM